MSESDHSFLPKMMFSRKMLDRQILMKE